MEECPVEAIILDEEEGFAVVDEEECVDCGACEETCTSEAIEVE